MAASSRRFGRVAGAFAGERPKNPRSLPRGDRVQDRRSDQAASGLGYDLLRLLQRFDRYVSRQTEWRRGHGAQLLAGFHAGPAYQAIRQIAHGRSLSGRRTEVRAVNGPLHAETVRSQRSQLADRLLGLLLAFEGGLHRLHLHRRHSPSYAAARRSASAALRCASRSFSSASSLENSTSSAFAVGS